ncbi:MAG: OmpA family protein, partial [Muribaculaceae bacterium]|nr:OmpA family protein [Muribaculaceae bacterium]
DALNNQVNDLRGALANCNNRLAAAEAQLPCPEVKCPECPEAQPASLMSNVQFTLNSAQVRNSQMINVYSVAKWMNENPNAKVVVKGYADKNTGSSSYNMSLSEKRAQNVYKLLVDKYGIAADRLTVVAEGSDSQVYDENNWNRVVVFVAE